MTFNPPDIRLTYRIEEDLFVHSHDLRVQPDGLVDAALQLLQHAHARETLRVRVETNHSLK